MSDPIREREKYGRKKPKTGELGDGPSSCRSPWYFLNASGHVPGVGFENFDENVWGEKASGDGGDEAEAELDPLMIFGSGIMTMILNKLDARSVARSRLVCREWLKVASSDIIWDPKEMTSNSSMPRTRTTARMSVILVPDKNTIIKDLRASLAREQKDNGKMIATLHTLQEEKHELEEHKAHLQALLEQTSFIAVQRHQQDALVIQEQQDSVQYLTMHNEHLQNQVQQLQDAFINLKPEMELIEEPREDEAVGDGEIFDD